MPIWSIVVLSLCGLCFISWLTGIIWVCRPFKAMKWFFHDILGWHKPDNSKSFDGCSYHSNCRFCGKEIMQDSQGNWFTFN